MHSTADSEGRTITIQTPVNMDFLRTNSFARHDMSRRWTCLGDMTCLGDGNCILQHHPRHCIVSLHGDAVALSKWPSKSTWNRTNRDGSSAHHDDAPEESAPTLWPAFKAFLAIMVWQVSTGRVKLLADRVCSDHGQCHRGVTSVAFALRDRGLAGLCHLFLRLVASQKCKRKRGVSMILTKGLFIVSFFVPSIAMKTRNMTSPGKILGVQKGTPPSARSGAGMVKFQGMMLVFGGLSGGGKVICEWRGQL